MSATRTIEPLKVEYLVGVYWFRDGRYGGMMRYYYEEAAIRKALELEKARWNKTGESEVRIIKRSREVFVVDESNVATIPVTPTEIRVGGLQCECPYSPPIDSEGHCTICCRKVNPYRVNVTSWQSPKEGE